MSQFGLLFSSISFSLMYVFSCIGLGCFCLNRLFFLKLSHAKYSMFIFLSLGYIVGQTVYGTTWQTLAVFSLFNEYYVYISLFFGVVAGGALVHWGAPIGRFLNCIKSWRDISLSQFELLLIAILLAVLLCLAILVFSPEGIDALAFYMAQPKIIAATGSYTILPGYENFAEIGLTAEMSYAAQMLLASDQVGRFSSRMVIWFTLVALLGVAWEIGRFAGLKRLGCLILLALILTSTAVTNIAFDGKTDLFATTWALGAICVLMLGSEEENSSLFLLGGILGGMAISAKLSLLPILPVLMFCLVVFLRPKKEKCKITRKALILSYSVRCCLLFSGGILGVLPLIIKNFLLFDEPFAPVFYFSSQSSDLIEQVWYAEEITSWIVKTYPLALVFGRYPMQHGNISVLILAFLPLYAFSLIARPFKIDKATVMFISGVLSVTVWVLLKPSILAPRYILPGLIMLFPAISLAAERAIYSRKFGIVRFFTASAIVLMLCSTMVSIVPHVNNSYANWLNSSTRTWTDPVWSMPEVISNEAEPGTRVLNAMYSRFPLRADLLQCVIGEDEVDLVYKAQSTEDMWESVHRLGAKFLTIYTVTHQKFFTAPINTRDVPDWLTVTEQDFGVGNYKLYRLYPTTDAPPASKACVEVEPGVWQGRAR